MAPAARQPSRSRVSDALERGREAYERHAWQDAFASLTQADREASLADPDLERLAWAAVLAGEDDAHVAALERLHDLRVANGDPCGAARVAFWLVMRLFLRGETGQATGWLARAERVIENERECVERGYLLIPHGYAALFRRNAPMEACDLAHQATEIGERMGDANLASLARMLHGQARAALGEFERGLALLDESMLAATRGRLSPHVTGIVYCAVIGCCQQLLAIDRAREWTAALDAWRSTEPQLVAFTGSCLVHRSEILQIQGEWQEAMDAAQRAVEGRGGFADAIGLAAAYYQQGEILRLRGEFAAAESAYRSSSQNGREPQPGLALLRLACGQTDAAAAAIRQVVGSARDAYERARYLPAAVEILLAAGDPAGADHAANDLERIAAGTRNDVLDALASHARGSVQRAHGDARGALAPLRRAFATWLRAGAPYLAARLRAEIAAVLTALGDDEGAALERDAARAVFRDLGAQPDLARLDAPEAQSEQTFGLTARELEVLRLLADGRTNRSIAQVLFLSEKTIDRHVSNIFAKLDVPSRSAATAFAYQNKLV
jgi:DNA-binding NarL/FixJ family response regulator